MKQRPRFLLNKTGIPLTQEGWHKLWAFYQADYVPLKAELEQRAREKETKRARPEIPQFNSKFRRSPSIEHIQSYLNKITKYFNQLQYNHTGTQLFDIHKNSGFSRLMESAKLMVTYSLPIKCMEAVILSIYLTNQVSRLVRFPVTFKSSHNGIFYYHIVLGLIFDGKFGSVGLSRKSNLMGTSGVLTTLGLIKYVHSNYDMVISLWYFDAFFTFLRVITKNKAWHVV